MKLTVIEPLEWLARVGTRNDPEKINLALGPFTEGEWQALHRAISDKVYNMDHELFKWERPELMSELETLKKIQSRLETKLDTKGIAF